MTRLRRARAEGERGAALVEFAMVALILILLAAGAYDFGVGWRTGLAVNEGARAGARVGSSQGAKVEADFALLSSAKAALDSSGVLDEVTRVVIYRANGSDGKVPTPCTNSNAGTCNILSGAQLRALPDSSSGAINSSGCVTNSIRRSWCPTTRKDVQIEADYLGVWIQLEHPYTFDLIGDSVTIEREAVMRLEPQES